MSPNEVNGLGLWLDASTVKLGDGESVTRWADASGHKRDAVFLPFVINWKSGERMTHQPPTIGQGTLRQHRYLSFNALYGQTLLLNEAGGSLDRNLEGFTLLFICRSRQLQPQESTKYLFISHNREHAVGEKAIWRGTQDANPKGGATRLAIIRGEDTGGADTGAVRLHSRRARGTADGTIQVNAQQGQFGDMEWGVSTFTVDYLHSLAKFRYNGKEVAAGEIPGTGKTEDYDSPVVAIASTSEGNYLTCDIAEIIAYQRLLTNDELNKVESALIKKYGL